MERLLNRWYLNRRARGEQPEVTNWFSYQKNKLRREIESIGLKRRRQQVHNPLAEEESVKMDETNAD